MGEGYYNKMTETSGTAFDKQAEECESNLKNGLENTYLKVRTAKTCNRGTSSVCGTGTLIGPRHQWPQETANDARWRHQFISSRRWHNVLEVTLNWKWKRLCYRYFTVLLMQSLYHLISFSFCKKGFTPDLCPYVHILPTSVDEKVECFELRNFKVVTSRSPCINNAAKNFKELFSTEIGSEYSPSCMVLSKKDLRALLLALPEKMEELQLFDLSKVSGWASWQPEHRPYAPQIINEQIGRGLFAKCDIPSNFCLGEYTGMLLQDSGEFDPYAIAYPLCDTASGRFWHLSAQSMGNHMRCINDPTTPEAVNASMALRIPFVLPDNWCPVECRVCYCSPCWFAPSFCDNDERDFGSRADLRQLWISVLA